VYFTYKIHRETHQELREVIWYETQSKRIITGDHPELDTSELCTEEQISQYQSMIGSLQWIVTIGRFDIHTAVMTMSGFRIAPRISHLKRLQRIYGYLSKMRFASIRVRTEVPDFSYIPDPEYDWT
jgi:hypothetical protein